MQGNLFVVSRLGQVRNVQTLIRQLDATDNHLVVLETRANPGLSAMIAGNTTRELFDEVIHITQPDQPLKEGRRKNRVIYAQIEDVVVRMADKGVRNLFLCNVDAYYSFFERVVTRRSLPLTLNLLEEGLGTYANVAGSVFEKDTRPAWSDVSFRAKNTAKACTQAVRALLILAATALSWALRLDLFRVRRNLMRGLVEPRYRYGRVGHFDRAYLCFPQKVDGDRLRIDSVHQLDFYVNEAPNPNAAAALDENATVFVSQKYIPADQYIRIVFQILDEMGVRRVYFKFHPREDRASFARVWDEAAAAHPRLEVLSPRAIQSVPVEQLMATGKVTRIIGLTSTSLMYAKAFFDDIDAVSVGERFRRLAYSEGFEVSKKQLAEFERDLAVFTAVSGVAQRQAQ